jgi:hypothetical protein
MCTTLWRQCMPLHIYRHANICYYLSSGEFEYVLWLWGGNPSLAWVESANELYRPSDRHLLAKLVPTLADRACHVVSLTDPFGRILGFLDLSRYLFFQIAPQLYSTRLSELRSRLATSQKNCCAGGSNPVWGEIRCYVRLVAVRTLQFVIRLRYICSAIVLSMGNWSMWPPMDWIFWKVFRILVTYKDTFCSPNACSKAFWKYICIGVLIMANFFLTY